MFDSQIVTIAVLLDFQKNQYNLILYRFKVKSFEFYPDSTIVFTVDKMVLPHFAVGVFVFLF